MLQVLVAKEQPGFLNGFPEPLQPVNCVRKFQAAYNDRQSLMSQRDQMPGSLIGTLKIVGNHGRAVETWRNSIDQNDRKAPPQQAVLAAAHGSRCQQHSIYAPGVKRVQVRKLLGLVFV